MNRELVFVAFLLFLSLFMLIGQAIAQTIKTPTPGVSPGNTFTYDRSVFWSSTDPNAAPPADLVEENKTVTERITVTKVVGTVVYMNFTRGFKNGTESKPSEIFVDILRGLGDGFLYFVPPKLQANNVVYYLSERAFLINASGTRTYSFGVRETARSSVNSTNSTGYVYAFDDIYFDKETGAMLEWYTETVSSSSPNEKTSRQWKIKELDLTKISEDSGLGYWLLIVAIVSVVAVSMAVIVFIRKHGKRRRRRRRK